VDARPDPRPGRAGAAWLAADLLEESVRPAPAGVAFTAPARTLRQTDRLLTAGRFADVATALTRAGVPAALADGWVTVLRSRVATGQARLTRRLATGVYSGGAVRWVDAGTAGVWLVQPDEPPDDDADDAAEPAVRLTDAG